VLASGLHYAGTLALRACRAWHVQARRQHTLRVAVCASWRVSLLRRGVRALVRGAAMGQAWAYPVLALCVPCACPVPALCLLSLTRAHWCLPCAFQYLPVLTRAH
jgi:hypothetical protein